MNERITQQEWDRRIDAIKLCGRNRGPHDWIPVRWRKIEDGEQISDFMCRVCYHRVSMATLAQYFPELKML